MKKKLALLDFDYTISTEDSMLSLVEFVFGRLKLYSSLLWLAPQFAATKLKWSKATTAKEVLLHHFFAGWPEQKFHKAAFDHARTRLNVLPLALEKIKWHRNEGHDVYVVTASLDAVLHPWTEQQGIGLIATHIEIREGKITGWLASPNCKGEEKVRRIREEIDLERYDYIYAYGNTKHDLAMMELANERFYDPFEEN